MLFPPHGCAAVEPEKGIRYSHGPAPHVRNEKIRPEKKLPVAEYFDDRLVGQGLAVGAAVAVEIVEIRQLRQTLEVVGRLERSRRMGQYQLHAGVRCAEMADPSDVFRVRYCTGFHHVQGDHPTLLAGRLHQALGEVIRDVRLPGRFHIRRRVVALQSVQTELPDALSDPLRVILRLDAEITPAEPVLCDL